MAAGRTEIDFAGIGYRSVTYKIDASTITFDATKANGIGKAAGTGDAVMLSAAGTIALTSDAAAVLGKLLKVESDGKATVQEQGYMQLPGGSGATLTVGTKIVGDLGAAAERGFIRSVAAATLAEVAVAKGEIVDASVATAVWVKLD